MQNAWKRLVNICGRLRCTPKDNIKIVLKYGVRVWIEFI